MESGTTQLQSGVFISHAAAEKAFALKLQEYLKCAFGAEFPIFVSSDDESIRGGTAWFNYIRQSIKNARVVLVLLSRNSLNLPWINFEAGVGDGANATVIPVLLGNLDFSALGPPLNGFHGRRISEVKLIIGDIADAVRGSLSLPPVPIAEYKFCDEIAALDLTLADAIAPTSIVEQLRQLKRSGLQVRVSPSVPAADHYCFTILDIQLQTITIQKLGSSQIIGIPLPRISEVLFTGETDPPIVSLRGRLQWLTVGREWKFLPEESDPKDALRIGVGKLGGLTPLQSDAIGGSVPGFHLAWCREEKLSSSLSDGAEVFYDGDGRYIWRGSADSRDVLILSPGH